MLVDEHAHLLVARPAELQLDRQCSQLAPDLRDRAVCARQPAERGVKPAVDSGRAPSHDGIVAEQVQRNVYEAVPIAPSNSLLLGGVRRRAERALSAAWSAAASTWTSSMAPRPRSTRQSTSSPTARR